ncbi:MAG: hypothetical protein AB7W16_24750 [Candidatus Obscuribacterales bacterium]
MRLILSIVTLIVLLPNVCDLMSMSQALQGQGHIVWSLENQRLLPEACRLTGLPEDQATAANLINSAAPYIRQSVDDVEGLNPVCRCPAWVENVPALVKPDLHKVVDLIAWRFDGTYSRVIDNARKVIKNSGEPSEQALLSKLIIVENATRAFNIRYAAPGSFFPAIELMEHLEWLTLERESL